MAFVGTQAPNFKLQNENSEWISLSDFLGKNPVLLVFYPGDFTPVCTKQLCSYQDNYNEFQKHQLQVLGISANSPAEHGKFKAQYGFCFPLLSDTNKETAKNYGITSLFLLGGLSRAVFILSKSGKVLYRYVEPTPLTRRKPKELLQIIESLKTSL